MVKGLMFKHYCTLYTLSGLYVSRVIDESFMMKMPMILNAKKVIGASYFRVEERMS